MVLLHMPLLKIISKVWILRYKTILSSSSEEQDLLTRHSERARKLK